MGIVPTRLIQELDEALQEAGLGWIPSHLTGDDCTEPIQVRVPLTKVYQFRDWLYSLSERFSLPFPRHQDYLCGDKLKNKCTFNELAYLYDLAGLAHMKALIETAFESGESPGFMALEP